MVAGASAVGIRYSLLPVAANETATFPPGGAGFASGGTQTTQSGSGPWNLASKFTHFYYQLFFAGAGSRNYKQCTNHGPIDRRYERANPNYIFSRKLSCRGNLTYSTVSEGNPKQQLCCESFHSRRIRNRLGNEHAGGYSNPMKPFIVIEAVQRYLETAVAAASITFLALVGCTQAFSQSNSTAAQLNRATTCRSISTRQSPGLREARRSWIWKRCWL